MIHCYGCNLHHMCIIEYLKIIRRLEKEQKNLDFLLEKMLESEVDLVQVDTYNSCLSKAM